MATAVRRDVDEVCEGEDADSWVKDPPSKWMILLAIGPAFVWAAEYIGSGELILASRVGAVLGPSALWVVVFGVFLKYWIGLSGARYTVCTGESMIDMFARIPGPANWVTWVVLSVQLSAATISMGAVASAAGVFLSNVTPLSDCVGGWVIAVVALVVVWSGRFSVLKVVMSGLVLIVVVGVLYVAAHVLPPVAELLAGLVPGLPPVPEWAIHQGAKDAAWSEALPLLGWGAGGFASQVWYSYWVLGSGYGAAEGRGFGRSADEKLLQTMSRQTALKTRGWCRVMYVDASFAMVLGIVVTCCFLLTGAGILGSTRTLPADAALPGTLSKIFSSRWGEIGGILYVLAGLAALTSTLVGQMAGWPRLLADCGRVLFPKTIGSLDWKLQFRSLLLFFFFTNMFVVYTLGYKPVLLVQISAVLEGLLLAPLQALWVGIGLFYVMPRLLSDEASEVLKPSKAFALGLAAAFLVFGYFCIVKVPDMLL